MTNHSLFRATATALVLVAACKSNFPAGSYGDGGPQDVAAQEAANSQEGGPPTGSSLVSCDPFQPTTKPVTLTTVLGVGRDTDGTLYVVDQPQAGSERVFVSSGGTLQRQRSAGSGTESSGNGVISYTFSISDHVPPFMLKLETNTAGPTAMGVLQGDTTNIKTFTIGQQGSVLTLVPTSQIAGLPVANIPAQTFIEYNTTLSGGRALLVLRPLDDWTFQDFRVFFGAANQMIERPVGQVIRLKDGGSTTINFTSDGVAAVASFPVSLTGVAAPPSLTIGTTQFPLTLGPTASPPSGYSYSCFGNPSLDGGAVDGPSSPDGASAGAQEGGPPTSSSASCDPFQPAPIGLTAVLGAGRDTDGTLYVVDQPQPFSERVFVSSGGTLQRHPINGSGGAGDGSGGIIIYSFSISDHVPPFTLELETNAAGPVAMGVLQGILTRSFTIGQQGTVLTLVPASQIAAMPATDIPAFLDYNATLSDGRALLVVSPVRGDGVHDYFRVFFGATSRMIERSVVEVNQDFYYSTTIRFSVDGVVAVANFPVISPGVPGPATLTIDSTQFPLTLQATDSPPTGYTYACPGDSSTDAGVDAWVTPADGPATCRPPSPDYGPTSIFSRLPYGTPYAATTCPSACGSSAWSGNSNNIDVALPYGACAAGTPPCSTAATVPCACRGEGPGPVDGFNCSCEGGTWICRIVDQGASVCMPCPDAGAGSTEGGNVAGTGGIVGAGGAVGTGGTPGSGGTVGTGGTTGSGGAFGTPCTTNQDCPSDAICCDGGSPSCDGTRLPAGDSANPGEFLVSTDGLTVTDTMTGLVWQRDASGTRAGCSADGNLRCTWAEAQAYCASLALGGLSGWRLPAWKELVTIADLTTDGSTSSIDQTAFSNTPAEGFWTSSPYVGSSSSESYVDFANGSVGNGEDRTLRVRCVRGSRCYPTSRFVVLDGEVVRDTLTGLVWQQKPAVSSVDGPCMDWTEAQGTCSSLGSGFRLPTLKEWDSLLCPTGISGPSLDKTAFPIAFQANSRFWTSSPYALPDAGSTGYASPYTGPAPGYARYVDLGSSVCASFGKLWGDMRLCFSARCVR